jgi:hypothetical protein
VLSSTTSVIQKKQTNYTSTAEHLSPNSHWKPFQENNDFFQTDQFTDRFTIRGTSIVPPQKIIRHQDFFQDYQNSHCSWQ